MIQIHTGITVVKVYYYSSKEENVIKLNTTLSDLMKMAKNWKLDMTKVKRSKFFRSSMGMEGSSYPVEIGRKRRGFIEELCSVIVYKCECTRD